MKFMKVFLTPVPTIILVISLFVIGCADYDEDSFGGPYPSERTWKLMTTKEKIIHDQIASKWDQSYLTDLRAAVRKRTLVPKESEMPFGDMPGVIVTINEVKLNPEGQGDSRKDNRFSTLDHDWYRVLKIMAEKGTFKELEGTPAPPTKEELAEIEAQRKAEEAAAKAVGEKVLKGEVMPVIGKGTPPVAEVVDDWDPNDVAPPSVLKSMRLDMLLCVDAQEYFDSVMEQNRPILRSDVVKLQEMFSICNAKEIQSFYKG